MLPVNHPTSNTYLRSRAGVSVVCLPQECLAASGGLDTSHPRLSETLLQRRCVSWREDPSDPQSQASPMASGSEPRLWPMTALTLASASWQPWGEQGRWHQGAENQIRETELCTGLSPRGFHLLMSNGLWLQTGYVGRPTGQVTSRCSQQTAASLSPDGTSTWLVFQFTGGTTEAGCEASLPKKGRGRAGTPPDCVWCKGRTTEWGTDRDRGT